MAIPGSIPFAAVTGGPEDFRYDVIVIWDPVPDLDLKRYMVYRAASVPVTVVNQGTKKFTIAGHYASWYEAGEEIVITDSTGNDGTYTIVGALQPSGDFITEIEVAETIPSSTADGLLTNALLSLLAYNGSSPSFTDKRLPSGFYYYAVYAVDKVGNFSDPSDIIIKSAPMDTHAPVKPTGLVATRTSKLEAIELRWNMNVEQDLKGYAIFRSVDGGSNYIMIDRTSSNKYKDEAIPAAVDTDSNTTSCIYTILAYDKDFNVSEAADATSVLEIPLVTNLRGIIDYLSINIYWNNPLPENMPDPDNNEFDVYARAVGTSTWTLVGTVPYPQSAIRLDGPLTEDVAYELAVNVKPFTGTPVLMQPDPVVVVIPDYTSDTTFPYAPVLELAEPDPRNDRILLSWMRRIVDDDLLYYDVKWSSKWDITGAIPGNKEFVVANDQREFIRVGDTIKVEGSTGNDGEYTVVLVTYFSLGVITVIEVAETVPSAVADGTIKDFITYATTKQNEIVFRNPRRSRTYGAPNYEMYFRVDAMDRANNRTKGQEEEVKLVSTDSAPPQWYDVIQVINSSYQGTGQHYEMMWDDAAQMMKFFKRYVMYESISWNVGGYPNFTFGDHEMRGISADNFFKLVNDPAVRGSADVGHIGQKWIVIAVEDYWGDVFIYDPGGTPSYLWLQLA